MNAIYPAALDSFLKGEINYLTDTILVAAVSSTWEYNESDVFVADASLASIIVAEALTNKTISAGEAFANPVETDVVVSGAPNVVALVIIKSTGDPATDRLIAYIDTKADTTPINMVADDEAITINWPNGRVFKI